MATNAFLIRWFSLLSTLAAACTPTPEIVVDTDTTGDAPTTGTPASTSDAQGSSESGGTAADESSDSTSSGSSTSTIDTDTDSGDGLVEIGGIVVTFDADALPPPVPGASVCAVSLDPPTCVDTDGSGAWSMMLAPNDDALRLEITAPGHLGLLCVTSTTEDDDLANTFALATDETAAAFWASCGATYPEQVGAVLMHGFSLVAPDTYEYLEGATASTSTGIGPCYMASAWTHDAAQTSTSADGLGAALFADLPLTTGTVDLTIAAEGETCRGHVASVDTRTPNVLRVPVSAGVLTVLDVVCEP